MPENPGVPLTGYAIPLTDKELITLGRITATWAQVDMCIDRLLALILDLTADEFATRFGDKLSGSKLAELNLTAAAIANIPKRDAIIRFIKAVNEVKGDRNHAVHGIWGWRTAKKHNFPAARHSRSPGKPLSAQRLRSLERGIADASVAGMEAISLWVGTFFILPVNFYFGSPDQPPERLLRGQTPQPLGRQTPRGSATATAKPPRSSQR